ncbi:hypothetical protein DFH09DRAFT_1366429, partial [Mycena vulgaris]
MASNSTPYPTPKYPRDVSRQVYHPTPRRCHSPPFHATAPFPACSATRVFLRSTVQHPGRRIVAAFFSSGQRHSCVPPYAQFASGAAHSSSASSSDDEGINDKHMCEACVKRFSRPSSLRIYSTTHTGATRCGREFNVKSNMRRNQTRRDRRQFSLHPRRTRPHRQ